MSEIANLKIVEELKALIHASKVQVVQSVNTIMVQTYWQIGKTIVEDEQKGQTRAEYGKEQLKQISKELTKEFGKGFDSRNLRNMRQFYLTFPKWNAVSTKLSWTHYRTLMRIENPNAREWYMHAISTNRRGATKRAESTHSRSGK